MIYFDNAATSFFKPPSVVNAVRTALTHLSANPGRGGHSMSLKCAQLVHITRRNLADFLGLECGSVVFTFNCTHALNFAIKGFLRPSSHVITTVYEHNSVLRPLHELARSGRISLTILPPTNSGAVSASSVLSAIRRDTSMVITNHISNVTGAVTPIEAIGRVCRDKGILYVVDGAQSAGLVDIDMRCGIDLVALAGHKSLHGPQGVGALAIKEGLSPTPILSGGTGTDSTSLYQPTELPESLESGTLPTPAIAGLNAGLAYTKKHMKEYAAKLKTLSEFAITELKKIPAVKIYTADSSIGSVVSFNVDNKHSSEIAEILSSKHNICVRGGLHCAPLIHDYLGTTRQGIVRASFGMDSSLEQVELFVKAIRETVK